MALTDYTSHPTDDTTAKVIFHGPQQGELPRYFATLADAQAYAEHVNAEWLAEHQDSEPIAVAVEYHS